MRNSTYKAFGVLALASTLAACGDDFLEGEGLTTDPNQPSIATIDQLYHSVQVRQFSIQSGDLARTAALFTQQMAGTDRQYTDRANYQLAEGDFSTYFSNIYTGGGLVDVRRVQDLAQAANDRTYLGIARVWEGLLMGTAADLWGDIPYSEAVGDNPKPKLDEQAAVYAAVQRVLSEGIADLQSGQGTGPGALDLVYGGNRARWIEAANTLKARFYMHWVEAQLAGGESAQFANTACGGNCIELARTAARSGISTAANNARTFHRAADGEDNLWYQFMVVQRPGYTSASRTLVELLRSRNDPRLTQYFAPTASGQVVGAPPASATPGSMLSATRGARDFRQPFVTYAETQLILAETNYRLGDPAAALANLNNARQASGLEPLTGLSGEDLLREIGIEYYISLFQQIEAWAVVQRLCVPALTPTRGNAVVGRLLYGSAERNANPNIPAPSQQPARNDNDPNPCPAAPAT